MNKISVYKPEDVPSGKNLKVAIITTEWNNEITDALLDGAVKTLLEYEVKQEDIHVEHVPGAFELTAAAKYSANYYKPDVVICFGCVVMGETKHFDYICDSVTQGITQLNIDFDIPFIFGLLTTLNFEQAKDRIGGKFGHKGIEAALTALKMADLRKRLKR